MQGECACSSASRVGLGLIRRGGRSFSARKYSGAVAARPGSTRPAEGGGKGAGQALLQGRSTRKSPAKAARPRRRFQRQHVEQSPIDDRAYFETAQPRVGSLTIASGSR